MFFALYTASSSSLRVIWTGLESMKLMSFSLESLKFFFMRDSIWKKAWVKASRFWMVSEDEGSHVML